MYNCCIHISAEVVCTEEVKARGRKESGRAEFERIARRNDVSKKGDRDDQTGQDQTGNSTRPSDQSQERQQSLTRRGGELLRCQALASMRMRGST